MHVFRDRFHAEHACLLACSQTRVSESSTCKHTQIYMRAYTRATQQYTCTHASGIKIYAFFVCEKRVRQGNEYVYVVTYSQWRTHALAVPEKINCSNSNTLRALVQCAPYMWACVCGARARVKRLDRYVLVPPIISRSGRAI